MVARRILESESLEDACSSCDERRPIVREATAQYAARRTSIPPTDLQAYEDEQSEATIESEDDGQPVEPIPEGEEPEEEDENDEAESEASPERWQPPPEEPSSESALMTDLPEEYQELGKSSSERDTEA